MRSITLLAALVLLLLSCTLVSSLTYSDPGHVLTHLKQIPLDQQTALDKYLQEPTDNYGYTLVSETVDPSSGSTFIVLNMTSVTFLNSQKVTCTNWWHWLAIVIPEYINPQYANKAILLISGGSLHAGPPKPSNEDMKLFAGISADIGAVFAVLAGIPNEPCTFSNDPLKLSRTEDAIISFGWAQFLLDQNPEWLVRLQMVKSSLLALDTVQSYMNQTRNTYIQQFVTAGASKRGWTTWLTGAVDTRIVGIVPIVMDELNFLSNIMHHYEAYCGWSFAIQDYRAQNITADFNNPLMQNIFNIEDPYVYRNRITVPKLMLSTSGDEFFLPDDSLWWYNDMEGEMLQRMFPNCEHSLTSCVLDVAATIESFVVSIWSNDVRPSYYWNIDPNTGTINVKQGGASGEPLTSKANLISATSLNNGRRDFRLVALNATGHPAIQPIFWSSTEIQASADGTYTAECPRPSNPNLWRACYITLEAPARFGLTYYFSTSVSIVPNTFPCSACTSPQQCYGKLV